MALSIRKKPGLIIPKSPTLILPNPIFGSVKNQPEEEIIEKVIKNIIKASVGINKRTSVKRLLFVPIYKKRNGEKEISKLFLKYKTRNIEKTVNDIDIESEGVSLLEFLSYIITNGAKEVQNPNSALEIM